MFILRRIADEKLEINTALGIEYVLVLREENKDEFDFRVELWDDAKLDNVYGLVCFEDSESIIPLYRDSSYYVMTSDGKTFSNISEKKHHHG
jgi:hypothetical protein